MSTIAHIDSHIQAACERSSGDADDFGHPSRPCNGGCYDTRKPDKSSASGRQGRPPEGLKAVVRWVRSQLLRRTRPFEATFAQPAHAGGQTCGGWRGLGGGMLYLDRTRPALP